jgi:hypothetical protein
MVGGECKILIDSFLWFGIVFIVIGIIWLVAFKKWARNVQEDFDSDKNINDKDKAQKNIWIFD